MNPGELIGFGLEYDLTQAHRDSALGQAKLGGRRRPDPDAGVVGLVLLGTPRVSDHGQVCLSGDYGLVVARAGTAFG
jgi:hypothetical protein